jgi:NCS1 family nucleobase:cation symporter-1
VALLSKFTSPFVLIFSMVSLGLATLATNIAANVVGPANDFAHLRPKLISFRIGGLITGIIGILIQPWRLLADASTYIDKWLIGYSLLLGACGGVLIADYYLIRRTRLDLEGLYTREGPYWYQKGFNPWAIVALLTGIGLCLPGFLDKLEVWEVGEFWKRLYDYAWFVSFVAALLTYFVLMKRFSFGAVKPQFRR